MDRMPSEIRQIQPRVAARECGGWLATAPKWAPLRIGVTGATEDEARDNFRRSLDEWVSTLSEE